ncbi:uncharacterized protein LOC18448020 [Amborella trichopoda]|uniref:tRNA-uridine aminocarboxypropyltransferase n=1 Tax=Amborella trichopoda TaxID=13333 RepID=U5DDY4_AMBTC|nr:uncharacterized protein LOC18448020 [Amborella trichopoda]ERN19627.1 hypothetical protein AMTR_s00062p00141820 [Amborella trichopoda]|eukprot:XP_020531564.1 uncharacterized protein LOC18448020 [Amborella trichopoda]
MANPTTKRPFCNSCSKPASFCICKRLKTPIIDNPIPITILQHSQEKKHPLNSTRIALLGLKNISVVTVSDIHHQAQFLISPLKPDSNTTILGIISKNGCLPQNHLSKQGFHGPTVDKDGGFTSSFIDLQYYKNHLKSPEIDQITSFSEDGSFENGFMELHLPQDHSEKSDHQSRLEKGNGYGDSLIDHEAPRSQCEKSRVDQTAIFTNPKEPYFDQTTIRQSGGVTSSPVAQNHPNKPDFGNTTTTDNGNFIGAFTAPKNLPRMQHFDQILPTPSAKEAISSGFVVKRRQIKKLVNDDNGRDEFEEFQEFEIAIPPGSALLFPSDNAKSFAEIDFEVKHLLVLDGTWGKARRIYYENPWLKLLPHLKLDMKKESLYSEVRVQPKKGCLSTIESIVCAFKALGDNSEGLDELLEVLVSMVGDQRRCKDERLSKLA